MNLFSTTPHGRLTIPKVSADDENLFRLVIPFHNPSLDVASPTSMIHAIFNYFQITNRPRIQLSWSYTPDIGSMLYNVNDIFRSEKPTPCSCYHLPAQFRTCNGHLHTMSTDWIQHKFPGNPVLAALSCGLNHIPPRPHNLNECLDVNIWVAAQIADLTGHAADKHTFSTFAETWTMEQLACRRLQEVVDIQSDIASQECMSYIRATSFTAGMDKANNTPFFMCKGLAYSITASHVTTTPYYKTFSTNPVTTFTPELQSILSHLLGEHVMETPARSPIIFPIYKPKKGNYRFICSTYN